MKDVKLNILESTLLLVLVVSSLKTLQISRQGIIVATAALTVLFFLLLTEKAHFAYLVFFVVVVYVFLLVFRVNARLDSDRPQDIHDGVIMVETSYKALFSGVNPYSVNLSPILTSEKYGSEVLLRPTIHLPYSPLMIIASAPFFVFLENLVGFF